MSISEIKHLFEPQSIAVIGASANPNKIGYKIVEQGLRSSCHFDEVRGEIFQIVFDDAYQIEDFSAKNASK